MIRLLMFVFAITLVCSFSFGQTYYQFTGTVVDENNRPIQGATVLIDDLNTGDITDGKGLFTINRLKTTQFTVEISFVGYDKFTRDISLAENKKYTFQLEKGSVKLDEVKVRDSYSDHKKKESTLNVEIVNDEYLKQNLGGSLMQSLERLPGVTTIDIGSGQSKPVIRGLGFNRVVVVENNIKHEGQQWGADHGLEIDQYAQDNIEIIKGPASLMYGSDAIGGVIDIKNRSIPAKKTVGATLDLTGKSNNDFVGTSVSIFGRRKYIYATARATIVSYGDYKVPTDSVDIYNYRVPLYKNQMRNTAGKERNLHTSIGFIKDHFKTKINVSNVYTQFGFFANAHGLEPRNVDLDFHDASNRDIQYPFQKVNHFKIINRTSFSFKKWRMETDLGYQRNYRQEWSQYVQHGYMPAVFPESLDFNPELERQFQKEVYAANVKSIYSIDRTELTAGINSEYLQNSIDGRGFIIPSFKQLKIGGFVFAKHSFSKKSDVQAGVRSDFGNLNTSSYNDWFLSPIDSTNTTGYLQRAENINRSFTNFTWSIGYNYNPKKWSYKLNIGKSFRMPISKELAANGVNYHRFSYEVGNANLSPEISYQLDAGIEYSNKKVAIGASPFINYFTNYIYLNPTSRYDRLYGFGNQVFEYTEAEVFRYGGEIHGHYELFNFLQFGLIGEYVYAEQLSGPKKGYTLPFAPPASGIINIKYHHAHLKFIHNAYASLDYRLTAAQNNIVPPEEPTEGYQLFNFSLGGNVFFQNQEFKISMQVQNLLNTNYFNHTSYYRLINVPEPSRNFIINISIPIQGNQVNN